MLLQLIVVILVCGIVWQFLLPYVAEPFKTILIVLVVLVFCLWLLSAVGLFTLPVLFSHRGV